MRMKMLAMNHTRVETNVTKEINLEVSDAWGGKEVEDLDRDDDAPRTLVVNEFNGKAVS